MAQNNLLDMIMEKTSNTETFTNSATVKQRLNETLKTMAKREKLVRECTIMFKLSDSITSNKITDLIEDTYCNKNNKPSATYWFDKEFAFVQFITQEEKGHFLDWIQPKSDMAELRDSISPPNDNGEHLQRKLVRVVLNNVRKNIKLNLIEQNLKRILADSNNSLKNLREGKPNSITGARAILFHTDSEGFKTIFGTLEGAIPYVCTATNTKTKLFAKINCKPWACNDCFEFGRHECKGKICAKCGTAGHQTKNCENATKYCSNCRRKGHRARDTHCTFYLGEVAKELRKVCIPIEYFADKELRFYMIKHHLQIN